MATIDISGLRHEYANGHLGLDAIDLTVRDGEFLALLGPSGSGKTTLLRTIAGFLRPAAGTLAIGGQAVAGPGTWVPPERRRLGMVFQDHAIWPHLSVAANVAYPLKLAGVARPEATARVAAVLEQVGLGDYARRKPSALSGGQRQRVALARAIVANPRALLLDEALSALDEPLRARLRLELKALTREQGLTAVHVTHDRGEALALADRVVVLNAGRIEQVGTPRDLLETPASAFVAAFVSDATAFPGTVVHGVFRPDHGGLRLPRNGVRTVGGASPSDPSARSRRAVACIAPSGVRLERAGATADPAAEATVTSALYGPHGFDVSLDWQGVPLRAHVSGWAPREGDRVRPVVERAHLFPASSGRPGTISGAAA
ncbi:hypothetical protein GCM10023081_42410 [Arthrobacter ginkgonis]|uniref:ABC transporter domain-containing protein n=1 Tax=Arthrobacter ginkgonis TaxID=1630594 RepID=A0ABP7DA53_9MICC